MDIIIGWKPYETLFNGATITMQLRPLKTRAMLLLTPYMRVSGDKDIIVQAENSLKVQQLATGILPDHVKDLEGLTVNGLPPTWEMLAEEAVFCPLVMDIIGELAMLSRMSGDDEKKSGGPSASPPPEGPTGPS